MADEPRNARISDPPAHFKLHARIGVEARFVRVTGMITLLRDLESRGNGMFLLFAIFREGRMQTRESAVGRASLQLDPLLNFEILRSAKSKPPRKIPATMENRTG